MNEIYNLIVKTKLYLMQNDATRETEEIVLSALSQNKDYFKEKYRLQGWPDFW